MRTFLDKFTLDITMYLLVRVMEYVVLAGSGTIPFTRSIITKLQGGIMVNMLNEGWLWYKNMGLDHAMISIPLLETAMLFIALTLCLLFRCSRTGLILAYLFVYRWGWSVREQTMSQDPMTQTAFLIGYLVFGILVFTFTVIGMLHNSLREE